jgi:hypothetical protein
MSVVMIPHKEEIKHEREQNYNTADEKHHADSIIFGNVAKGY